MRQFALALFSYCLAFLRSRHDLGLGILALRQQAAVLKRKRPRAHLNWRDRLFWVMPHSLWDHWRDALIIVEPATVVAWHRAGFRLYWRLRSRASHFGRPMVGADIREALERMAKENPSWGAPRIHGELLKLGFDVSERTVSRYLARHKPTSEDARKKWAAFLKNHREAIAAMDFFTVPTLTFRLLYCFFVAAHDRRKILHFNVTAHPTAEWVCQQLRESFPNPSGSYKYVIMDRDSKFSGEVVKVLEGSGMEVVRTSVRTPQQNGIAERWVETARRDCFDHVIALSESHVRRLGREMVSYYHEDRTHLGFGKDTPNVRTVEARPGGGELESRPRLGGLHHRYVWKAAA